jgi:transposase
VLFRCRFVRLFFRLWKSQTSVEEIACQFDLSAKTVRRLCGRFEQLGEQGLQHQYQQCGKHLAPQLKQRVAQMRQAHPEWGAELIRIRLSETLAEETLPSARTMQRWLKELELNPAPQGRRPQGPRPARLDRAERPHQAWQIDAAEELKLKDGSRVCWLRVVDECSGAFLQTQVFSHPRWEHVAQHAIQRGLRKTFARWGIPERIQFDNGYPWGSTGQFPPAMALWVMGLGVKVVWSWPACPQENGVVERSQGTGKRWAEPQTCEDAAVLQKRLNELDRLQREQYPYEGRTRLKAFPKLSHSGRPYIASEEGQTWKLSRVLDALSDRLAVGQVDRYGGVSVYNYSRFVGKPYVGQKVYITLDPSGPTWVFSSSHGEQWRTHPADELTQQRIVTLNVGCKKGSAKPR